MTDDLELRQVKDAAKATAGHRRSSAEHARHETLIAEIQVDGATRFAELRSDRPAETGDLLEQQTADLETKRTKAIGLLELAGLTDADMPWSRWKKDLEERLRVAETAYVRNLDEAENAAAYGVDADQAQFTADQTRCDVEALQAAIDDATSRAPAPNRAARRASGKGGRTTTPPPAGDTE